MYINGKKIPCEICEIKTVGIPKDIDDFELHFNPNKEVSLSLENCKFNNKQILILTRVWGIMKWYQKLRVIILDWLKSK
jgi:hypothetical protein